jgi:hypothetical protein
MRDICCSSMLNSNNASPTYIIRSSKLLVVPKRPPLPPKLDRNPVLLALVQHLLRDYPRLASLLDAEQLVVRLPRLQVLLERVEVERAERRGELVLAKDVDEGRGKRQGEVGLAAVVKFEAK